MGAPLGARAPVVADRFEAIARFAAKGRVLDVGCVDARHPERAAISLHARLRALNPSVRGVERDPAAVEAARAAGFDVVLGDAERDPLGGPFDCVVGADVIEHLRNPGLFLENVARSLAPGGVLVLSTPNPFRADQFRKVLRHGRPEVNPTHTLWFDPLTLRRLLEEAGYEEVGFFWVRDPRRGVRRLLARLRPYFHATFVLAARPRASRALPT